MSDIRTRPAGACTKWDPSIRRRAWSALGIVLLLVAGMLVSTGMALPAPDALAASVGIGTIQAKVSDHRGVNNGTTGNCITYSPVGTGRQSSALVTNPGQALTAHGRPQSQASSCPSTLSTATQSAVGFTPSTVTAATDGVPFLIGRMVHYNNPVYADDRYFTGKLAAQLAGFNAPNAVTFDWQLDETPNTGGTNCCDDVITFTTQISDITLTQGGQTYRLVILGFEKVGNAAACPAAPGPNTANEFLTKENSQTHACLYASLVQTRKLTVVKRVAGPTPPAKTFGFASTSTLAGSPWAAGTFTLADGGSTTREIVRSETVGVTEQDPGDDRWALTSLACTQIGAGGAVGPLPGAMYDLQARRVTVANVPAPPKNDQPDITCTFTNTYTPRATLTLIKRCRAARRRRRTGRSPPPRTATSRRSPADPARPR